MEYKEYKKKLESHIKALENAYNNTIILLNDEIEKDDSGKIKLSSAQRKNYIESVQKSAVASNDIMTMIRDKYTELEALNHKMSEANSSKEPLEKKELETIIEETTATKSGSALNEHLT